MMQALRVGLVIGTPQLREETLGCLRALPVELVFQQPALGGLPALSSRLQQMRPDVFVLDISDLSESVEAVIAAIRAIPAPPAVIALSTKAEAEIILGAIRAGAS